MLKISLNLGEFSFSCVVETIAKAYDCIKVIVENDKIMFPNTEETLSEYIPILADFKNGKTLKYENLRFSIEKI